MSTFVRGTSGDIPASVTTLERLLIWLITLLAKINPSYEVLISPTAKVKGVRWSYFQAEDGFKYFYGEAYIRLGDDWVADNSQKTWAFAEEAGSVAIPANWKS